LGSDFGSQGEKAREEVAGFLKIVDERAKYYEEKAATRERTLA
jgi:acyl-[acyl-carrier-protein] desaturase